MSVAVPSMPTQANRHFLEAVVNLSEKQEISLSEDVYSEKGVKLLAAGSKVSSDMYSRIISHKLAKPVEFCLSGEPPSSNMLVRLAEEVLDRYPLLSGICKWQQGRVTPLGMLGEFKLAGTAGTLLSVAFSRSEGAAQHAVMTSLIAMGIANAYRYSDAQLMAAMCMGGIFHDIGELYVDPAVTRGGHQLSATEWMSYASHPIIGAALAREMCGFDVTTQRAILEHHEYADGFGYPRSLRGHGISVPGRLLSLSEVLAGLVHKPSAANRIDIALKIMPGEHEPELVSLVNDLLRESRKVVADDREALDDAINANVHVVFKRIAGVMTIWDELTKRAEKMPKVVGSALDEALDRFAEVQKAFASTGVTGLADLDDKLDGDELQDSRFEAHCVLNEIAWRLQKLSRELVLKSARMPEHEARVLMDLANALAGREAGSVEEATTEKAA